MSVKNKVKRLNKRILELEEELKKVKSENITFQHIRYDREEEEQKIIKDNFIKMIINQRKPVEHDCCRFTVSERQLKTMGNGRLEVERNREYFDAIDFILKI
ncbi:MAG: hypothetical protein K1W33_06995 [Clostridia bacterium]